ncbi:MAG TPA: hypothetical protein VGH17_08240 [Candidatus Acidoferrales bacterium]|jgi:hypothetical protein
MSLPKPSANTYRPIVRDVTPGKGMGVGIVAMSQEGRARYFSFLNKLQS